MRVYIAGPYTIGNQAENVRKAMDAANTMLEHRLFPYIPHLFHFMHMVYPRPYREWMEIDVKYLEICDAVLRLPGESRGADEEVKTAEQRGIHVAYKMTDLLTWAKGKE